MGDETAGMQEGRVWNPCTACSFFVRIPVVALKNKSSPLKTALLQKLTAEKRKSYKKFTLL